jgi:hypothetical protein
MEKSSQIAWKIVPLRDCFPLKVVPLIEVLLYNFGVSTPGLFERGTADNPQIGQVLKVTDICGDGCAVIQPNSFPDTEQVLDGFVGMRRMSGLRTVTVP